MKHPERLSDYLDHIAVAITRATGYVQCMNGAGELEKNQLVQDGVVRNIEIIGEAATHINRVAPDFIREHLELPWAQDAQHRHSSIFCCRCQHFVDDGYGCSASAEAAN